MPHITVKGMQEEELRKIALDLKHAVVESAQVKEEYVKIFYSPIRRVDEPDDVAVDVYWIPRPQELCDRVADAITALMQKQGAKFVQVTFTEFPGPHFYENGVHY